MQLDKLQAELRQRSSWEAIDLGVAMYRRWWKPTTRAWLTCVFPVYGVVWALLHDTPFWAFVLLWWLKPLWDRVPLLVLSRTLFGEEPRLTEVLRALPRLWRRHLIQSLLLLRLDPARSFYLPVLQLEGNDRRGRRRRRAALMQTMGGPAAWLTLTCLGLELVVFAGLLGLVLLMIPESPEMAVSVLWERFWEGTSPPWLGVAIAASAAVATAIVEPLYVAAGFSLYLNRRTRLEGWDIELLFRRLSGRLREAGINAGRVVGAALLLGSVGLPWLAADAQAEPAQAELEPEAAIADVLELPEFGHQEKRTVWRRIADDDDEAQDRLDPDLSFLERVGEVVAMVLEGILWGVAGVVLAGLLLLLFSRLRRLEPRAARPKQPPPRAEVGRQEAEALVEMPADIPAAARELWRRGHGAEALGMLYRGALQSMTSGGLVEIGEHATEGECLAIVRRAVEPEAAEYFQVLTRAWQQTAYGQRPIEDERFGGLCDRWPQHYPGAR